MRQATRSRAPGMIAILCLILLALTSAEQKLGNFYTVAANIDQDPTILDHSAWYEAANSNLSQWRNSLFLKTMQMTKDIHKQRIEGATIVPSHRRAHAAAQDPLNAERPFPQSYGMYSLSNPFISCPPGFPLGKVGGEVAFFEGKMVEDGHKFLCSVDNLEAPCTVLSIGSRADTTFEEAILKRTPCEVVTLDCTLKEPLKSLGDRHKFFPLCLGSEQQSQVNAAFVSLPQLMAKIGRQRADILKMDIEGYEWDVLASLGTEPGSEASLPTQLAIEFHVGGIYRNSPSYMKSRDFNNLLWPLHLPTFAQLQLLMLHIMDLGYGIISRDDNPVAGACTELTFHRILPTP